MKGTRDGFRGGQTLNKVKSTYLEGKLKEAKFHWGRKRLKTEKQRTTSSEDKL